MDITATVFQILLLFVLVGILPACAYTYCSYRIGQRELEVNRILEILEITSEYGEIYNPNISRTHFVIGVGFAMLIATMGLSMLLLGDKLELAKSPNLLLGGTQIIRFSKEAQLEQDTDHTDEISPISGTGPSSLNLDDNENQTDKILISLDLINYQTGALFAYGLGFLGAYLWGLQNIFRRYAMNDLIPLAFFRFGLRMLLASVVALLIYHVVGGFGPATKIEEPDMVAFTSDGILIATAFMVGMFPQQGIRWMTNKLSMFAGIDHPSVRKLPMTMIEGVTSYDIFRLEELGLDTCYDLSRVDFIPLLLKTSYGARELIDWILQAKLCVRFGDSTQELRERGIRTILDFKGMDVDNLLEDLAKETSLTLPGLKNAAKVADSDENIKRLNRAADLLSRYWEGEKIDTQQVTPANSRAN